MDRLFTLDAQDYTAEMSEIRRTAVRGIIFIRGRLLLIENRFGQVKLPGGGIEPGEDDHAALIREVLEETGFRVIPASIRPYGEIEEKRRLEQQPVIWHVISRLYFCDVREEQEACSYTADEQDLGFHQVLYPLEEAIRRSERKVLRGGVMTRNEREYRTLQMLREHLQGGRSGSAAEDAAAGRRPET